MGVGMYAIANLVERRTIGWAMRDGDRGPAQGYGA